MDDLPLSPTAIDDGRRQLQDNPSDRHNKQPNPKLAYDDPITLPKVVDPSENYGGDDSDPTDEDPVIDNNDNTKDDEDSADGGRGGSNDSNDIVICQYTSGGVFVGGAGGRNDIEADVKVLASVVAYDYEIDSSPPRVDILGIGAESTALAMDLILDRDVVPQIEKKVTKCVVKELFGECEQNGSRRHMTSYLEDEDRNLAIVGVGKEQEDQLEYFGSCEATNPNHLCDIINGEMKLFHDDASTVEQEKIDALLSIKKCLESDELLESVQIKHDDIKDIRFKAVGEDIPGNERIEQPIEGTPAKPMSAAPFIAMGASVMLIIAFLVGYRRYMANDEEEKEEDSDEESNPGGEGIDDAANIEKNVHVPGAVGLGESAKPPALNFDQLTEEDVQSSVSSKTPNASAFQPAHTNLLDIPESESGLDLLNTNTGSMDFGSSVMT